jgi:hypothetical protein
VPDGRWRCPIGHSVLVSIFSFVLPPFQLLGL